MIRESSIRHICPARGFASSWKSIAASRLSGLSSLRGTLNTTTFCCRTGISEIEFLRTSGLLAYDEAPVGGPGTWRPTEKGREHVEFLLGDRNFLPLMLIQPSWPIRDDDVLMCQDFFRYLESR